MGKKQKHTSVDRKTFLETILIWIVVGVFAVLPLLYFPGRIASYVTSKQYFFIGAVNVAVVLWAWLALGDARYRLTKKNLLWLSPLFLFLSALTISAIVGIDTATSFFSTVETGTGLILLYHVFFFACIVASLIRVWQKQLMQSIFKATLFSSTVLAIATFYTGGDGLFDIGSTMLNKSSGGAMMGNSSLAGAYFIFGIFFALLLILQETKAWKKVLYWLCIAIIVLSPIYFNVGVFKGVLPSSLYLFMGQARFAAISLAGGLLISFLIWLCTRSEKKVKVFGIAGLVAMGIVAVLLVQQVATPHTSLNTLFVKESGNRTLDWQASIEGIKEKPLLGWGSENFHVVYQKHLDPIVFSSGHGNEVWALHPHNDMLEVLVNGGLIGGLLYLLVIGTLFASLYRLYKKERIDAKTFALLTGMLIAFIVQQQMVYESIVSYVMLFSVIGLTAGLSDSTNEHRAIRSDEGYAWIVLALMIPVWIYGSYLPARKMEELQTISTMPSDARTKLYGHVFHSAGSYAIATDIEFFTDPLFYSYDSQKEQLKANPTYQKVASGEIDTLIKEVHPIWLQNPFSYHLSLSLLHLENLLFYLTDDTQYLAQADMYAKRAFELSPADPQVYTIYAQTLIYEKKILEAKKLLDKAIALNADYKPAVVLKDSLK